MDTGAISFQNEPADGYRILDNGTQEIGVDLSGLNVKDPVITWSYGNDVDGTITNIESGVTVSSDQKKVTIDASKVPEAVKNEGGMTVRATVTVAGEEVGRAETWVEIRDLKAGDYQSVFEKNGLYDHLNKLTSETVSIPKTMSGWFGFEVTNVEVENPAKKQDAANPGTDTATGDATQPGTDTTTGEGTQSGADATTGEGTQSGTDATTGDATNGDAAAADSDQNVEVVSVQKSEEGWSLTFGEAYEEPAAVKVSYKTLDGTTGTYTFQAYAKNETYDVKIVPDAGMTDSDRMIVGATAGKYTPVLSHRKYVAGADGAAGTIETVDTSKAKITWEVYSVTGELEDTERQQGVSAKATVSVDAENKAEVTANEATGDGERLRLVMSVADGDWDPCADFWFDVEDEIAVSILENELEYTGEAQTPIVDVKNKKDGNHWNPADYTITYPANSTEVGSYTATVSFKNYLGTIKLPYSIKKVAITKNNLDKVLNIRRKVANIAVPEAGAEAKTVGEVFDVTMKDDFTDVTPTLLVKKAGEEGTPTVSQKFDTAGAYTVYLSFSVPSTANTGNIQFPSDPIEIGTVNVTEKEILPASTSADVASVDRKDEELAEDAGLAANVDTKNIQITQKEGDALTLDDILQDSDNSEVSAAIAEKLAELEKQLKEGESLGIQVVPTVSALGYKEKSIAQAKVAAFLSTLASASQGQERAIQFASESGLEPFFLDIQMMLNLTVKNAQGGVVSTVKTGQAIDRTKTKMQIQVPVTDDLKKAVNEKKFEDTVVVSDDQKTTRTTKTTRQLSVYDVHNDGTVTKVQTFEKIPENQILAVEGDVFSPFVFVVEDVSTTTVTQNGSGNQNQPGGGGTSGGISGGGIIPGGTGGATGGGAAGGATAGGTTAGGTGGAAAGGTTAGGTTGGTTGAGDATGTGDKSASGGGAAAGDKTGTDDAAGTTGTTETSDDTSTKVKTLKKGETFKGGSGNNKVTYKVTKKGSTVEVSKIVSKAKATKITIPATVKGSDGKTYKVTAIAASAMKGAKKVTSVTIGKNVLSIGTGAFSNCPKLKTLTIKATGLKKAKVKGALKGSAITKIKVPATKKAAYKKIFTKANVGKKVTVA